MSAELVAALDDVLDLYEEPSEPQRPNGNCAATRKQRLAETRVPLPANPGQPALYASASQRQGTRHRCMCGDPPAGWRPRVVPAHRPGQDFAHHMQWRVDARDPAADIMRVVRDKLTTPKPASLYEAFDPVEARRILKQLACHYTPKHGSWLNMAEIELSISLNFSQFVEGQNGPST